MRRDDHRDLARVSNGVRAAVATGENLTSISQFVPLLLNQAADVVQVAVQSTGITGALRVAEMSDAFGLPVALVNCPGRYAAHVAAVLPHHLMMEVVHAGRDAVFRSAHRLEDGSIVLGDDHGLGITFDEARLASHAVEHPPPRASASPIAGPLTRVYRSPASRFRWTSTGAPTETATRRPR